MKPTAVFSYRSDEGGHEPLSIGVDNFSTVAALDL
jgi:hypothetical protein